MRVKVGDQWFEPSAGQPLMVELSEADKKNIGSMHPESTRYAVLPDGHGWTRAEWEAWMVDAISFEATILHGFATAKPPDETQGLADSQRDRMESPNA